MESLLNMKRHSYSNVTVQFVFKSACFSRKQNSQLKIHLFSFLNTKQTNDDIFLTRLKKILILQIFSVT